MDRKKIVREIDLRRQKGEAALAELRQKVDAARKAYDEWEKPRRDLQAAIKALESEADSNDRCLSGMAAQLRQDAMPKIEGPRRTLVKLENETLNSFRSFGNANNAEAVNKRAATIRAAIRDLDALATSDEDTDAGIERILATIRPLDIEIKEPVFTKESV